MGGDFYLMLNEAPWAGPSAARVSGSDVSMKRGRKLKEPPGPLSYELRVDKKAKDPLAYPPLDWHNAPDGQALFSDKLVKCLAEAGVSNIDYYDATVHYLPTGAAVNYKVANVIGIASVLNLAESEYNADEDGFIIELLKIRIDPEKCKGQHFFRFLERPSMLVISRRIKEALEAASITGTRIIEDKDWAPGLI